MRKSRRSSSPTRTTMSWANNAINTDVKHARAFGAHVFAAGYGERSASDNRNRKE